MKTENSQGKIFYGMHFYPGVAEYQESGREPYRIFLNEATIRSMGPTFAGRPVFVMHVDDVKEDVDELRKEADGWVIESFFNEADGKHWVKFIAVTEKAEQAIKRGMQLSNCYAPKKFAKGGLWNGVAYLKEVTEGEYEHLAIVPNPRYAESVILTPEKFKQYNEEKFLEIKRLSNAREKSAMKVSLFKRSKVENSAELLEMSVLLPNSKKDVTIQELIEEGDARRVSNAADPAMLVTIEIDGEEKEVTVSDLVDMVHNAAKKKNIDDPDEDGDPGHGKVDMASKDKMNKDEEDKDEDKKENEDDEEDEEMPKDKKKNKKKKNVDKKDGEDDDGLKNELEVARVKAKEKADKLRNADKNVDDKPARVEMSADQVARGKARYGSN
jgi:hypothetical protein